MKKTILFFCGDPYATGRFAGICAYGRQRDWIVKYVNYGSFSLESYLSIWKPDGILTDSIDFAPKKEENIPTVFLDAELSPEERETRWTVDRSPSDAAHLALAEFERLGLTNLAYLPPLEERSWSDRRRAAFIGEAEASGKKVREFQKRRQVVDSPNLHARLSAWAESLPRPCGVFAANDGIAATFLSVCALAGIKVPDELAVIGVDGKPSITDNTYPSLTSIAAADTEGGRLAAELLDGVMTGTITEPEHRTFGELGILHKDSTKRIYERGSDIRMAREVIRREACTGLKARDVLALMHGSRRSAEMRFRAQTGMSILEAINKERLEQAKRLLKSSSRSIADIAHACGYSSVTHLRAIFEREMGLPMGAWRKAESV